MEASKATTRYIKQVASDPQAAQINLMRHQQTDLPSGKHKRKAFKPWPQSYKWPTGEQQAPPYKRGFDTKQAHTSKDRCSKCGDSKNVEGLKCSGKKYQCKTCHKYGHFTSLWFTKQVAFKPKTPKAHQLQAEEIYMQDDSICGQSEEFTTRNDSFCLQMQIQCAQAKPKLSTTSHLITNLAYKLQPQHK